MSLLYAKDVANEIDRVAMDTIRLVLCMQVESGTNDDTAIRARIAGIADMAYALKEAFSDNKEGS